MVGKESVEDAVVAGSDGITFTPVMLLLLPTSAGKYMQVLLFTVMALPWTELE